MRGTYYVVRRPAVAARPAVDAFVDWLWSEVRRQGGFSLTAEPVPAKARRDRY